MMVVMKSGCLITDNQEEYVKENDEDVAGEKIPPWRTVAWNHESWRLLGMVEKTGMGGGRQLGVIQKEKRVHAHREGTISVSSEQEEIVARNSPRPRPEEGHKRKRSRERRLAPRVREELNRKIVKCKQECLAMLDLRKRSSSRKASRKILARSGKRRISWDRSSKKRREFATLVETKE